MSEMIITEKELKEIGIEMEKKVNAISDDELENISGGFTEVTPNIATTGMNIKCPVCNAVAASEFDPHAWVDKKLGSVEYHCNKGHKFVCYDGFVIMKDAFINICKSKKYNYPHANV